MADEMLDSMTNMVKTTIDELLKVLNTENVIGETMEVDDKVIIPITKIGLLFGTGSGSGGMGNQKGAGAGAGGGAGIEPISVVVAFKNVKGPEGVQVLSVRGMGPISKIITDVGQAAKEMIEKSGGPEGMMKKGMQMKEEMQGGGSKESEETMPSGPGSKPEM